MKRFGSVIALLLIISLSIILTGCTKELGNSESDSKKKSSTDNSTAIVASDDKETKSDEDNSSANTNNGNAVTEFHLGDNISSEEKTTMANLTGNWEALIPNDNGTTAVIRAKIDNVSGFTLTTGIQNPDGNGTFYSRVGSYSVKGDQITFSATTGGESNDGSSYQLRQDPGVFKYTYTENPEQTQLVLTPVNDNATNLTGPGQVVLNKT